jgi:hypothetical protein
VGQSTSVPIPATGSLTPLWRALLGAGWMLAFFAYAAVWSASVQIGIGTWWIGPRGQPSPVLVKMLPFVLCLIVALCALYSARRLVAISAVATLLTVAGAVPDLSRSIGLGVAELVISGCLAVVTTGALTGRYRLAPRVSTTTDRNGTEPGKHDWHPPSL